MEHRACHVLFVKYNKEFCSVVVCHKFWKVAVASDRSRVYDNLEVRCNSRVSRCLTETDQGSGQRRRT